MGEDLNEAREAGLNLVPATFQYNLEQDNPSVPLHYYLKNNLHAYRIGDNYEDQISQSFSKAGVLGSFMCVGCC